jgi:hypothetical protein
MISPVENFTEHTCTKQHYVKISYTKFNINRTINAEITVINSLTLLGKVPILLCRLHRNSRLPQVEFLDISCIEHSANPMKTVQHRA